ncbi:SelT/selW/selH selenoprotein [Pedobacter yulinensis]|uniref:SelT/selW/selH selenoprotein n=1 Tax=Pedobacter yulinensis TaxID=2126353 RepID=A0A2T3HRC4_9SPHI|nr:SelT/SelW/SelH family protein [Pedobacter yulinensis]PST84966.1 SelT/selW/selH selenoprotein [Pedobacter yulinensis]
MKPTISITYCPKCGWMLRSAYMAQELLSTFTGSIHGVTLVPSDNSGVFRVSINDTLIFDRSSARRFPEIKELKQLVRDHINPGMDLGHSDRKA